MRQPSLQPTWLVFGPPMLARTLSELAPEVTIDVVMSGPAFLDRLAGRPPDLALAVAPPTDRATIERLAEATRNGTFAAVLLDEPDEVDERLAALQAGLHEALPADASPREIVGRLRLLTATRGRSVDSRSQRPVAIADGTFLDLDAHALMRDGRHVHLRPRELALLATMASQPGRVFTRRELDERAWGNHRPQSRRVDVHVRWLRVKLEPDPDAPRHLITVRRVGYRLDPAGR